MVTTPTSSWTAHFGLTTATIGTSTFLFVAGLLDDGVSVFRSTPTAI